VNQTESQRKDNILLNKKTIFYGIIKEKVMTHMFRYYLCYIQAFTQQNNTNTQKPKSLNI